MIRYLSGIYLIALNYCSWKYGLELAISKIVVFFVNTSYNIILFFLWTHLFFTLFFFQSSLQFTLSGIPQSLVFSQHHRSRNFAKLSLIINVLKNLHYLLLRFIFYKTGSWTIKKSQWKRLKQPKEEDECTTNDFDSYWWSRGTAGDCFHTYEFKFQCYRDFNNGNH